MPSQRAWLAAGMILVAESMTRADPPPPTPFTTMLRAHLAEWGDKSGVITPQQADRLMKKRNIQGDEAAAIVVVKMNSKEAKTGQPLPWTLQRIEEYEAAKAQKHGLANNYDKGYALAQRRIKADPHVLFADGAPHLNCIHQLRSGDCWLLSTIGAMIHRNPAQARRIITDDGGRIYTVHFAIRTFKVPAPTDAEIGGYTADRSDGDWLYVLENAVGQFREKVQDLHKVAEANDDALIGGSGTTAIQAILGHDADQIGMSPSKPNYDLVRHTLTRAFGEHRLVILGTTHDKTIILPKGIAHGHAMALIGWDAAADRVTIWNPWGNTMEPKGSDPLAGFHTVDGVFTMPLSAFTRSFAHINVENDKPFIHKKH